MNLLPWEVTKVCKLIFLIFRCMSTHGDGYKTGLSSAVLNHLPLLVTIKRLYLKIKKQSHTKQELETKALEPTDSNLRM